MNTKVGRFDKGDCQIETFPNLGNVRINLA